MFPLLSMTSGQVKRRGVENLENGTPLKNLSVRNRKTLFLGNPVSVFEAFVFLDIGGHDTLSAENSLMNFVRRRLLN